MGWQTPSDILFSWWKVAFLGRGVSVYSILKEQITRRTGGMVTFQILFIMPVYIFFYESNFEFNMETTDMCVSLVGDVPITVDMLTYADELVAYFFFVFSAQVTLCTSPNDPPPQKKALGGGYVFLTFFHPFLRWCHKIWHGHSRRLTERPNFFPDKCNSRTPY